MPLDVQDIDWRCSVFAGSKPCNCRTRILYNIIKTFIPFHCDGNEKLIKKQLKELNSGNEQYIITIEKAKTGHNK